MSHLVKLVFFLMMFLSLDCGARTVILQSPLSSAIQYNEFLNTHPEMQSFVNYVESRLQKNQIQESQLFKLADVFNQSISETLQTIKTVQNESPLTLISLRYVRDLSEKALAKKLTPQERQELLHLYCRSSLLLHEGPLLYPCSSQYVSLSPLKKRYPQLAKVLVETIPFTVENQETIALSQTTAYQWTLLSNAHGPIRFFGTYEQLLNQQFLFEDMINGNCEGFSHQNLDFELINEGIVFFSEICQKKIKPFEDKKSWVSENKNLLLVAGALIVTGLVYNYTKGKKYVIDTRTLR